MSRNGKDGPPLRDDLVQLCKIRQDRRRGLEFVRRLQPMMSAAAVERAREVRLKPGDPARDVLGGC
jgi:hypothetical protein